MRSSTAMRSEGNVYYLPRDSARPSAVAVVRTLRRRTLLLTGSHVVIGALIGFGLANLPAFSRVIGAALQTVSIQ